MTVDRPAVRQLDPVGHGLVRSGAGPQAERAVDMDPGAVLSAHDLGETVEPAGIDLARLEAEQGVVIKH